MDRQLGFARHRVSLSAVTGCTNVNLSSLSIYRYQLLQILQKYGEIEHFNFVYHINGPNTGQPKGFAFVKYKLVSGFAKHPAGILTLPPPCLCRLKTQ